MRRGDGSESGRIGSAQSPARSRGGSDQSADALAGRAAWSSLDEVLTFADDEDEAAKRVPDEVKQAGRAWVCASG